MLTLIWSQRRNLQARFQVPCPWQLPSREATALGSSPSCTKQVKGETLPNKERRLGREASPLCPTVGSAKDKKYSTLLKKRKQCIQLPNSIRARI